MDFKEIDRALARAAKFGEDAYNNGLSKYCNPHDPGSLSFDRWAGGWKSAKDIDEGYQTTARSEGLPF